MINIQSQQVLLPKKVYIGDSAELRCSFNSSLQNLTLEGFVEEVNFKEYEIKDIQLNPAGVNYYQLSITFVPWKTGDIYFPNYKISGKDSKTPDELQSVEIAFNPVNIVSISEQAGTQSLQETAAPLLLPGTAYKLYGFLILTVLILIASIQLIVKRKAVRQFLKQKQLQRKYKKNAKITKKQICELFDNYSASKENDCQIADKLQKIIRNYLWVRFEQNFKNATSAEIITILKKTGTELSFDEEKNQALAAIGSFFVRTDDIRYNPASAFENGEANQLKEQLLDAICVIEKPLQGDSQNA